MGINCCGWPKKTTRYNNGMTDDATPLDLLSSDNYTTREVRNERYDICLSCDRLFGPTRTCKECGCFMAMKTWLKMAGCPLQKWGPIDEAT